MPGVLDRLDAGAVRRWAHDALDRLRSHRDEIDGLNVFPVPDGDTGTNLYLTVESAVAAVEDVPDDDVRDVADALATGAVHGARGSSGVILSQLLQGWADALREHPDGGAGAVRTALARAADSAYAAVSRPSEGTMLSVARAAADGAARGGSLREVVSGALTSARAALDRTPNQLDALGRAGVVDAGGRGLLLVLESLAGTVTGRRVPRTPGQEPRPGPEPEPGPEAGREPGIEPGLDPGIEPGLDPGIEPGPAPPTDASAGAPSFEVMYLLDAPENAIPPLRERLDRIGDSVVVVGGPGGNGPRTWRVHVHTADVRAAVEAAEDAAEEAAVEAAVVPDTSTDSKTTASDPGPPTTTATDSGRPARARPAPRHRPRQVRVTCLPPGAGSERARRSVGVVAVAGGTGLAQVLAASGALVLVRDPQGPPSAAELLQAARDAGADAVVVLLDGPDAVAAARSAVASAREHALPAVVLATEAPAQALAALAVHDACGPLAEVHGRMTAAAAATRHGAVVPNPRAAQQAGSTGGVLGLVGGRVVTSGDDPAAVGRTVADRLLDDGGELLTVLTGAGSEAQALTGVLCQHVRDTAPDVDVHVLDCGQEGPLLLLGAE